VILLWFEKIRHRNIPISFSQQFPFVSSTAQLTAQLKQFNKAHLFTENQYKPQVFSILKCLGQKTGLAET
jgi:hypothetical protein